MSAVDVSGVKIPKLFLGPFAGSVPAACSLCLFLALAEAQDSAQPVSVTFDNGVLACR